jgi:hypothetical protein
MSAQKMTRQGALIRALPILIFTLIAATIIILLVVRNTRNLNTIGPTSQDLTLLAPVCGGSGLPSAAVFDRQTITHPAVIARESNGDWEIDPEVVPAEFRPVTIGEVQLILCVSPPEQMPYPRCDSAEEVLIDQVQVRLVSARTGATIDKDITRPNALQSDCLPEGAAAEVTDLELWDWVRLYVIGGSET